MLVLGPDRCKGIDLGMTLATTHMIALAQDSAILTYDNGSEDLGNGLSVGFILENGSSSDSGALGKDGSIFNRESQIYLKTRFGMSRLA